VFADGQALARLNRIMHPCLRALLDDAVARHRAGSRRPLVLDLAVAPERAFRGLGDAVLWVRATRADRIRRLVRGRGLSHASALARVRGQWPDRVFAALADLTLDNTGTPAQLRRAAAALWPRLLHLAGGHA
jgi:dephospho-CoA kinase